METYGRLCFLLFVKTDTFLKRGNFYSCHISQYVWAKTAYTLRTRSVAMVTGTSSFSSHLSAIVALKVRYLYLIDITAGPAEESLSFGNQFEESFSCRLSKSKSFFSLNLILSSFLKMSV